MSQPVHDVVVVGAGPVGLFTAILAAEQGLHVAVVDSRVDPVDKACGEGLMSSAVRQLAGHGVDPTGRDFDGITYLDASGVNRAYAPFRAGPGRGVLRTVLHEALTLRAKELEVERVHGRLTGLEQDDISVTVHVNDRSRLHAPYLVAADGLHSSVRSLVGLAGQVAAHPRYGLRQHFATQPWASAVEVYWSGESEAYVTPVSDDLVGIAILGARTGGTFSERLHAFPAVLERLDRSTPVGGVMGAGPLRQDVRRRTYGRVALVGDAAGYVDALTGEGLAVGFASSVALVHALAAGDLRPYEGEWKRITRDYRWLTRSLVAATRRPRIRRSIAPAARRFPAVFSAAVNRLG